MHAALSFANLGLATLLFNHRTTARHASGTHVVALRLEAGLGNLHDFAHIDKRLKLVRLIAKSDCPNLAAVCIQNVKSEEAPCIGRAWACCRKGQRLESCILQGALTITLFVSLKI
jgi:hypothetical protein